MTAEELYLDAVGDVYRLAKQHRLAMLRGGRLTAWDGHGLHAISRACGRLDAARELLDLDEVVDVHPVDLRDAAERDAAGEYEREQYEAWATRMRLERREWAAA